MTDTPPPPRRRFGGLLVDPAPLRLDRDFRLLWIGQAISTVGRMITLVVLPYQVYVLTGDILAVGALSLVQLVPILIFALGGGAVADAVDRRRLLLVTQVGLAGCSLAFVLHRPRRPRPAARDLRVGVRVRRAGRDRPAGARVGDSAPRADRAPAGGDRAQPAGVQRGARSSGRRIGGIVLATAGVAAAYAIDVVTFAAAIVALLLIAPDPAGARRRPPEHRGRRRGPAVRAPAARGAGDVHRRPQRDGLRVAASLFPALALDVFRVGPGRASG